MERMQETTRGTLEAHHLPSRSLPLDSSQICPSLERHLPPFHISTFIYSRRKASQMKRVSFAQLPLIPENKGRSSHLLPPTDADVRIKGQQGEQRFVDGLMSRLVICCLPFVGSSPALDEKEKRNEEPNLQPPSHRLPSLPLRQLITTTPTTHKQDYYKPSL